jgi:DNA-directed RNA polymerase I subunit RPA2
MVTTKPNSQTISEKFQFDHLFKPHIESFNYMVTKNLPMLPKYIDPVVVNVYDTEKIKIEFSGLSLGMPYKDDPLAVDSRLFPNECREGGFDYVAPLKAVMLCQYEDGEYFEKTIEAGRIPVMVKSCKCHLQKLSPKEMVSKREEQHEGGGYFIIDTFGECG